ncbi:hypothetical protein VSAK1_11860 [Vibrio mediterranei AK1]|nr:hypothetical protein VSAK1_11860 [Vibrio mediterranei AK1]
MKVVTILAKKLASASPVSRLLTSSAVPVRGLIRSKLTLDKSADATQTITSAQKKRIAGSGILLPAFSIKFKKRSIPLGFGAGA